MSDADRRPSVNARSIFLAALVISTPAVRGAMIPPQPEPAAAVAAEVTCRLQPRYLTDRQLVYRFHSRTQVIPASPDPQAGGTPVPQQALVYTTDLTLRLTTLGVDEHGGASFALLFDKARLVRAAGEQEEAAEFTREQADNAEQPEEGAPLVARLAYAIAKSAVRLDVRADGVVTAVSGLEDAQRLAQEEGLEGGRLMGPIAARADARTLSMLFRVDAPGESGEFPARTGGEAWELEDRLSMSPTVEMVMTTSLKLESCSPEEARLVGGVRTSVETPRREDGTPAPGDPTQPTLEVTEQTDALGLTWDPKAGVLRKRERSSYLVLAARLGKDKKEFQTLRTKSTIELVEMTGP
jgi:hypothetical protein